MYFAHDECGASNGCCGDENVTVRDMKVVKNHDYALTTDCDETIDDTDDDCMFNGCNNRFLVKAFVNDVELLFVRDIGNFGGILVQKN